MLHFTRGWGGGGWIIHSVWSSDPRRFTAFLSLCCIAPLQPGVNHSSTVICQEFLSLFCCHFITGSSYQPAWSQVTGPSLSQIPICLIRDHHEMGWLVYRGSRMLEKVQSPLEDMPVTFWIIGFFCECVLLMDYSLTFTEGYCSPCPKARKVYKPHLLLSSMLYTCSPRALYIHI